MGRIVETFDPNERLQVCQRAVGDHPLPGYGPVIPSSPLHQREHAPAQVFTRVSGVALGFRG